ncbi:MAG: FTR1 family protein [Chloroflexota bacterium]
MAEIDGLFWQGFDGQPGLAQAIALEASPSEVAAIRQQLDAALEEAQITLGDLPSSPFSIISNSGIIVFRRELEAVVIGGGPDGQYGWRLCSLSPAHCPGCCPGFCGDRPDLVGGPSRSSRSSQASASVWRPSSRSSPSAVSFLLITNWFFHKTYWKDWMAGFHAKKRNLLSAETGQLVGLILLGFTSVYREGFETVLFLQALTLEAGATVVLEGVALGLIAVAIVGVLTFKLQKRLPYKKMLVWTGVLIGIVLVTMVGKTIHVMQAVGWMASRPFAVLPSPIGPDFGSASTPRGRGSSPRSARRRLYRQLLSG